MPSKMRQAIAKLMTFSKTHIPHYYLTVRAEVGAALAARKAWNAAHGADDAVSVNDLVVKAVALALVEHPHFNAFYADDALQPQAHVNVGIAIALPDGLVAPAILDCGDLVIAEIGRRGRDLAARARAGTLRAEEYTGATFTVTNLGMFGIDSFQAIVVPPQVGILAVGGADTVAAYRHGDFVPVEQAALTLSADHRATDGAEGARFLQAIAAALAAPERLFG
jgi:pyruvate dehydrogenase E2 component (dihydrolipoamide acetyltransferase)